MFTSFLVDVKVSIQNRDLRSFILKTAFDKNRFVSACIRSDKTDVNLSNGFVLWFSVLWDFTHFVCEYSFVYYSFFSSRANDAIWKAHFPSDSTFAIYV